MPKPRRNRINPENILNILLVLAVLLLVLNCRSDRETIVTNDTVTVQDASSNRAEVKTTPNAGKSMVTASGDKGKFIVEHSSVKSEKFKEFDDRIKSEKVLENASNQLNDALKLPFDIYLKTKECGDANALYNPNDRSITVCYELMEYFFKIFKESKKNEPEAYASMLDAVRFVFLHELGHAMIDAYKLPITGNEEDAADRASAYICLEEIDDGVKSVLAAAYAFKIQSKISKPKGREFSDEHLLEEQRFYNSLCMIYGSNTLKYANLVKEQHLPKERADRCEAEYGKTMQSWKELLQPWRRE